MAVAEDEGLGVPQGAWSLTAAALAETTEWKSMDQAMGEGLAFVARHSGNPTETASLMVKSLSRAPRIGTEEGPSVQGWLDGLNAALDGFDVDEVTVPGSPDTFLEAIRLGKAGHMRLATLVPAAGPIAVVGALTERVRGGLLTEDHIKATASLVDREGWDWEPAAGAVGERLEGGNPVSESMRPELEIAVRFYRAKIGRERLAQSVAGGSALHALVVSQDAGEWDTAALALTLQLVVDEDVATDNSVGQSATGRQRLDDILANPTSHEPLLAAMDSAVPSLLSLRALLAAAKRASSWQSLAGAALGRLAGSERSNLLTVNLLVTEFSFLRSLLGPDSVEGMVRARAAQGNKMVETIRHQGYASELLPLYVAVLDSASDEDREALAVFLLEPLSAVTLDEWKADFSAGAAMLNLALALEARAEGRLGSAFSDAVRTAIADIRAGSLAAPPGFDGRVIGLVEPRLRRILLREVKGDLARYPGTSISPALGVIGDALIESGELDDNADDFLGSTVKDVLERADAVELGWVRDALQRSPGILTKASVEVVNLLKDRILRAAEAVPTDQAEDLREMESLVKEALARGAE
jgi:hypothetical protein